MKFSEIYVEKIEPSLVGSLEDGKIKLGFGGREVSIAYNGALPPDYRRVLYKTALLAGIGVFVTYEDLCKVNKTFEPKSFKHEWVYQRCKLMTDKLHHLLGDDLFDALVHAEPDLDDIYEC